MLQYAKIKYDMPTLNCDRNAAAMEQLKHKTVASNSIAGREREEYFRKSLI